MKAVLIAIADVYKIDRVDSDAMEELTRRMTAAIKPGFHRHVLKDMGGIDYCMVDCFDCDEYGDRGPARLTGDVELLRPDLRADGFIYPLKAKQMERITGVETSSFAGWLKAVDRYFELYADRCCSMKIGLAYRRSLDFRPDVPYDTAAELYRKLQARELANADAQALADFMFHYILKKAAMYQLPLKFHTGLYCHSGYAKIGEMELNVRHLSRLAMAHPECKFIAMHIAYPFHDELVLAIRQIPNLYADMSWAWIVDPVAASLFLKQALTAAPVTKITGFGGDYSFVENTYGHLQIVRMQMARVLHQLVEEHYFSVEEALEAGSFLLCESAARLYAEATD